jgi:hypothetical protein
MALRPIAVIIEGRAGILVRLEAPAGQFRETTNRDGYCVFLAVPDGPLMPKANLFVDDPASEFYGKVIDLPPGGHQLFVGQPSHATTPGFDIVFEPLVPKATPVPQFEFHDGFFYVEGKKTTLVGCDCFPAYRFWLDGNIGQLDALIAESKEMGFLVWRIFMQGSISQNTFMELVPHNEPNYLPRLRPFVQYLNVAGIVPLLEVYVDNQVVGSGLDLWTNVIGQVHDLKVIISGGNEWRKNGFDPQALPAPAPGVLWSRGSSLSDEVTPSNGAPLASFHQRRDYPKTMLDAVASVIEIRDVQHDPAGVMMDEPIGAADTEQPGRRSANPVLFWRLGRLYGTDWSVAVFHSDCGIRGQLLTPTQKACGREFVRGVR